MNQNKIYDFVQEIKTVISNEQMELKNMINWISKVRQRHESDRTFEVALVTVAACANWRYEFNGTTSCLLPTTDCCMRNWRDIRDWMKLGNVPIQTFVVTNETADGDDGYYVTVY